jgi:hypothetical protein
MHFIGLSSIVLITTMAVSSLCPAAAQTFKGYEKGFVQTHENKPREYRYIADPTGAAPSRKVHSFSISSGCFGKDDCASQSVRSQLLENGPHVAAPDGWYGWWMYIPSDFVLAENQPSKGYYTFAQWKNHGCPHVSFRNMPVHAHPGVVENVDPNMLYIETSIQRADGECSAKARVPVISMDKIRGGWHKFEVYAEWSHGNDGRFVVYIDGKEYLDYKGSNQTVGWEHNYFQFGLYLCCTNDTDKVRPATIYYANISKAKRRENLK